MSERNTEQNKHSRRLHEESGQIARQGASNSDHNNASASDGGTTDMDDRSGSNASTTGGRTGAGSGLHTKTTVTGSDFDGQASW